MADSKNVSKTKQQEIMGGLKGLFPIFNMRLVQKKVNEIREGDKITGYYCDVAFSNGSDGLLQLTCGWKPEGGAIGNGLEMFKDYDLGCEVRDKKVKIVDYRLVV